MEYERLWGAEQEAWTAAGAKGSAPVMRKITTAATANVLAALKAIANLSADLAPPAWLDGATGPEPKDVIVFPNGLLDATTRQLHPASPCFFAQNAVGFQTSLTFVQMKFKGLAQAIAGQ